MSLELFIIIAFLFFVSKSSSNSIATGGDFWVHIEKVVTSVIKDGWENSFASHDSSPLQLHNYGDKYYYVGYHFKLTFLESMQFCENINMKLVNIRDYNENEAINKIIGRSFSFLSFYWTAGTKLIDNHNWIWLSSKSNMNYTRWALFQPQYKGEQCIAIRNTLGSVYWHDYPCDTRFYTICERYKPRTFSQNEDTATPQGEHISADNKRSLLLVPLTHYGDKYYYFGNNFKATFLQSMQFCKNINMKLLTIRDGNENKAIEKFIINTRNLFRKYWTAGTKIDNYNWIWMSYGANVNYTKWDNYMPTNFYSEQCITVIANNKGLFWQDSHCQFRNFFICERYEHRTFSQIEDMATSRWQNLIKTSSNVSSLYYNEKRYYFFRYVKVNYMEALQFCKIINMELVSVESKEENDKISKYIRDNNVGDNWWTSGSRLLDSKNWVWFTRAKSFSYTNWRRGEPLSWCMRLAHHQVRGLEWISDNCYTKYNVICVSGTGDDTDESGGALTEGGRNLLNQGNNQSLLIPIDVRYGGDNDISRYNSTGILTPQTTARNLPDGDYFDFEWYKILIRNNPGYISIRSYGGKRYHVETSLMGTQRQAAMYCRYHNMHLIEIINQTENAIIEKILLDTGSIGPFWTAGQRKTGNLMWSISQQPITYTNWNPNINLGGSMIRDCIQVDQGAKWSWENCDEKLFFVCKAQIQNLVTNATNSNEEYSQTIIVR